MILNQLLSHSLSSNSARGFRPVAAVSARPELPTSTTTNRAGAPESGALKTLQSPTDIQLQRIGSHSFELGTAQNTTHSSDVVTLSAEGLAKSDAAQADDATASATSAAEAEVAAKAEQQQEQQEQGQIKQLAARDREVRAHEQAHAAVGGSFAGAPSYELERGPDGVSYAVGGEVSIDVSAASTPAETISKAQQVRRAALAPAEPSPADRSIAAQASRMESQARTELNAEAIKEAEAEDERNAEAVDDSDRSANDGDASRLVSELVPGIGSDIGSTGGQNIISTSDLIGGNSLSSGGRANPSSNDSFLGQQLRQSILAINSSSERGSIINQVA